MTRFEVGYMTHAIARIPVEADSVDEALKKADEIFNDIETPDYDIAEWDREFIENMETGEQEEI